jgi:hypothetical protein
LQKVSFTHSPAQDNPAGGADRRAGSLVVRQRADGGDGLMTIEPGAPGIDSQFLYPAQFIASAGLKNI